MHSGVGSPVSQRRASDGSPAGNRRRATRAAAALVVALLAMTGCATKKDVRLLQTEMMAMQVRQDSLFRVIQQQNAAIQDSLRAQNSAMTRIRGDLGRQLVEIGEQMVQLQELAGQSQTRLNEIRQDLSRRDRELGPEPAVGGTGGAGAAELYQAGIGMIRTSPTSARQAFEEVIRQNPQDSLAAAAQYQIGETYVVEKKLAEAVREFERVVERWPTSSRAPVALFRAGVVAQERGTIEDARGYFNRVVSQYPKSEEATAARERLRKLPAKR